MKGILVQRQKVKGSIKANQTLHGKIVIPEIAKENIEFLTNFEIEALIQSAL